MSVNIQRKTFSTSEYHHMAETGILREDDRIELIEGEIISMAAIGSYHAACVNRLNRLFTGILSDTVIVSVQNPVTIGDFSEPEPRILPFLNRARIFMPRGIPNLKMCF